MRSFLTILFLAGLISTTAAQKTINDPNVEARTISGFHSIEVMSGIDLYLSEGKEAAAVSAKDEATRNRIVTEVKDGVLKIYFNWKDGVRFSLNNKAMRVYVSYKKLESLSASAGSDIMIDGSLNANALKLNISGGSDFTGRVQIRDLTIQLAGGSDIDIAGSVNNLNIDASGGSDVNGFQLVSEVCDAKASGGSDITITVNNELYAEASGGSDINWKGGATVKKSKASGAGSVSHRS